MSSPEPGPPKVYNGSTSLSGSASGQFGDRYNIQHAHYNFYGVHHREDIPNRITNYAHNRYAHNSGKRLALLAFDGGVVGGLESLLALKHFMERVARIQGLDQVPKPCEFFDMMGGADVGGLLVVLLGSFELTIDESIETYTHFLDTVISKPSSSPADAVESTTGTVGPLFDQKAVERFIKQVLRKHKQKEDRVFEAATAISCKVFVKAFSSGIANPVLLRSYQVQTSEDNRLRNTRLWHAVQATLAYSPLFGPVAVNNEQYVDHYCHNPRPESTPTDDIFTEAQTQLLDGGQHLEDHLDCLLAIGTKIRIDDPVPKQENSYMRKLFETSSANEDRNKEFCVRHPSLTSSGQLCRLVLPSELGVHGWLNAEHRAQFEAHIDQSCRSRANMDSMIACLVRVRHRQLTPGFAMIRASQQTPQSLVQSHSTVPQPHEISPYDARLAHYRRSQLRIRNTCTWIFRNTTFIRWCRAPQTAVLVCTGIVGCGKSILAAAVIDYMQELQLNSHGSCIHYFFETGSNSATGLNDMLRAMIKQLTSPYGNDQKSMPTNITSILSSAFTIRGLQPSVDDLANAFKSLVDILPQALYLIDGFDDLDEAQTQKMFDVLRRVFADNNPHGSKLALFSRETLGRGIETKAQLKGISDVQSIGLTSDHLSKDIERFVEAQVDEQQLRRIITQNVQLIRDIKTKLVANSDKMFLWIYFQIRTIWDPNLSKTDEDIRKLLEDLPAGLDKTYEMCLRRLESHANSSQQAIAVKAFRWVSAAQRPLTPRQMQEVVCLNASRVDLDESEILNSPVTDYCGNLLTVDITQRQVQFAHASVGQFLKDSTKIPKDLHRYHIDVVDANRECTAVCLSYMKWIQSRKQVAIRQNADITQKIPKAISDGIFSQSSKLASMARFALRSTTRTNTVSRNPMPAYTGNRRPARLEMHDYLTNYWLPHASDIASEDPLFPTFLDLCRYPEAETFPWLSSALGQSSVFQQLTQYAVINRHLPLLRVMRKHITLKMPGNTQSVFEDFCPGTGVRLVHLATALGFLDVLAELANVCDLNAYDDQGRSPIVWAVEKSCIDTIFWLAGHPRIDLSRSQSFGSSIKDVLCFLACLTRLDSDELFWQCIQNGPPRIRLGQDSGCLSQALFAACSAGQTSMARHMVVLGAELRDREFKKFFWPPKETYSTGYLPETAIAFGDVRALETMVDVLDLSGDRNYWLFRGKVVEYILLAKPSQALVMSKILCEEANINLLRTSQSLIWFDIILSEHALRIDPKWTDVLRQVMRAESYSIYVSNQAKRTIPLKHFDRVMSSTADDLAVTLLRLDYFSFNMSEICRTTENGLIFQLFRLRGSSRAILEVMTPSSYLPKAVSLDAEVLTHNLLSTMSLESICQTCITSVEVFVMALYSVYADESLTTAEQNDPLNHTLQKLKLTPYSELLHFIASQERWEHSLLMPLFRFSRCYRICKGNEERARRMYDDLKDIGDNCDVSLNFPAGYMKINGRWMIKLSIVGAVYRWNHRLRRQKNLPFSAADLAYREAIGLSVQEPSEYHLELVSDDSDYDYT